MSRSIITVQVAKGTFAWAIAMLAKGHVVKRNEGWGVTYHYQTSPDGLWFRVDKGTRDNAGEWMQWTPNHTEFVDTDWELL